MNESVLLSRCDGKKKKKKRHAANYNSESNTNAIWGLGSKVYALVMICLSVELKKKKRCINRVCSVPANRKVSAWFHLPPPPVQTSRVIYIVSQLTDEKSPYYEWTSCFRPIIELSWWWMLTFERCSRLSPFNRLVIYYYCFVCNRDATAAAWLLF